LIDAPDAMMGRTLADTLRPFSLRHQACYTCHFEGLRCAT
jgi:AdoMet-dependent heme synthase